MISINDVIQKIAEHQNKFAIKLNPPASASVVSEFEKIFELTLPADLLDFYRFSNGFETSDLLFRIIPLEDIVQEVLQCNNGLKGREFTFAEYMIYSDAWKIRLKHDGINGYEITNDNHKSAYAVVLTNSLFEFITRYLDGSGVFGERGLNEWFEQQQGLKD